MNRNKLIVLLVLAVPFLLFAFQPQKAEASLASLTAGATYITASGDYYGMNNTKISVQSTMDNNNKGALTSGCYGCSTGSQWKDGSRQEYHPNIAVATKYTTTSGQQWGISFDATSPKYTWGCGNSDCTSSTDNGDCNPFKITMTRPAESMFNNGYWVARAYNKTDPGATGNSLAMEDRTDSFVYNVPLNNGGRTYLRLDYRLNRKPTAHRISATHGTDTDNSYVIPAGSTSIPITLSGKFTELDPEKGTVQIMYKKTTDSYWTSFGSHKPEAEGYAEDPSGSYSARPNGITTGVSEWGWKTPNGSSGGTITFPNVNLSAGSYVWAVRAVDQYGNYGSSWSSQGAFTISVTPDDPTTVTNPTGCSCNVNPNTGLAPLTVEVNCSGTNLSNNIFSYEMGDGTPLPNRGATIYHTYQTGRATSYTITATHPESGTTCTVNNGVVNVTNPGSGGGGEVAP